MDNDKEHSILELETKSCSESQGWVGGKIHCHLCSSDTADETEKEEANTSAAWPLE